MKAVILTRVSSKEQEDGHSLAAQSTRLIEYAKRKNLEVIKSYQIIESSTHGKRKEFTEMLDFCKKQKETIAIIADAVDRVQRSFKESVLLDDLVRKEKIELHFYREGMVIGKNANSMDIMRWDFAVMGAKTYVLQLAENVKRSVEYKNRNGEFSGQAPTGYINCRNENGKAWLKPDEIMAPKIKHLFKLYSLGHSSIKELKVEADKIGAKSRAGKPMSTSVLYNVLTNPFYYGEMNCKGKTVPHIYEPIISRELWQKCQEVRLGTAKKPFKYSDMPFLYRGLIKCANTGKMCTNELKKGQFSYVVSYNQNGKRYYTPEKEIDLQIIEILKTLKFPLNRIQQYKKHLAESKKAEISYRNQEIGHLQADLTKNWERMDKLMNLFIDGNIDQEIFDMKKEQLKTEKNRLDAEIKAHSTADDSFNDLICELIDIASNSWKIFGFSGNFDLKRNLLKMVFRTLEIKEGNLGYALSFPFSKMQNLTACPNWLLHMDSNHD